MPVAKPVEKAADVIEYALSCADPSSKCSDLAAQIVWELAQSGITFRSIEPTADMVARMGKHKMDIQDFYDVLQANE
jgi:hypothetical protein